MTRIVGFGMARRVKSLAEARPKITKLYDNFIHEEQPDAAGANTQSAFESEFLSTSALRHENSQLMNMDDAVDTNTQRFIENELLAEPFRPTRKQHTKRINRKLDKDTRWGLAGELIKLKSAGFETNRLPTTDEVKDFLIREMFKDVEVYDLVALNKSQLADIGILATGYSNRHVFKTAKALSKEMEKLDEGLLRNAPRVHGRKDDEWVMFCIGTKFIIHLMTENAKEDAAIADKWLDQTYWNSGTLDASDIRKKFKEYENPFKFRNVNK